jgi:ADP-heptose:LPS heptosyltransferase
MASDALVVTGGGVGNLIQATPLLVAAAHLHNSPVDVWLANENPRLADVIRGHEAVRRVSHVLKEAMGPVKKYTDVYYTFLKKGKVAKKVPAANYHASWHPKYPRHESDCAMSAIRGAGYHGVTPPTFCCHDPFPHKVPPGVLVGFSTGSKVNERWKLKRYPSERCATVCELIHQELPFVKFVHAGIPSDGDIVHPEITDFRGVGNIREQFGLVRMCTAFISNDSGLMHAAAAQGIQTFGIFGPTNLWKNLPVDNTIPICLAEGVLSCMPCQKASGGHGLGRRKDGSKCAHECMELLDPEVVATSVISFLRDIFHEVYDCNDSV